ncbi:uncharacterized protein LOC120353258 [Nilaparvata lugens]|uniref:uncharacterized protein LOC120353258 n=1 Tax=Nilaparvata lugens TaxID=108931 RepID=UPI00193DEE3F|nr:uncharacterized protein LOC120353258 [Nilaparvata lugens]
MLNALRGTERIHIDATFKTVPAQLQAHQLLTIHGEYMHHEWTNFLQYKSISNLFASQLEIHTRCTNCANLQWTYEHFKILKHHFPEDFQKPTQIAEKLQASMGSSHVVVSDLCKKRASNALISNHHTFLRQLFPELKIRNRADQVNNHGNFVSQL